MLSRSFLGGRSNWFWSNETDTCSTMATRKRSLYSEVEPNLYLFQFYHELDIKRVMEGSLWSFNRKPLIISRMKEGEVRRSISLNNLDLWVQVYDLRVGFMSERVLKEVGNYIGVFVESCSRNFFGTWKEFLRVRVSIDVT